MFTDLLAMKPAKNQRTFELVCQFLNSILTVLETFLEKIHKIQKFIF